MTKSHSSSPAPPAQTISFFLGEDAFKATVKEAESVRVAAMVGVAAIAVVPEY